MADSDTGARDILLSDNYGIGSSTDTAPLDHTTRDNPPTDTIRVATCHSSVAENPFHDHTAAGDDAILKYMPILVIELAADGTILFLNRSAQVVLGYTVDKVQGKDFWEIFCPDNLREQADAFRALLDSGDAENAPLRIRTKKGQECEILWSTLNVYHTDNSLGLIRAFCVVTSGSACATGKLTNDEFLTLFNGTGDAVFVYDLRGNLLDVNYAASEYLGYTREELLQACSMGENSPVCTNPVLRHLEELIYFNYVIVETRYRRRDGSPTHLEESCQIIEYLSKPALLVIGRNISRWKRMETETREQNEILRSIFRSIMEHIAVLDKTGTIIGVNDAWESFSAANGGNLLKTGIGANYIEVCRDAVRNDVEGADKILAGILGVLRGEQQRFLCEYPCAPPGETGWFLMFVTPLDNERGVIIYHLDITDHKATAMDALLSKSVVEQTSDIVLITDTNGIIRYVNPSFEKITGYSREDVINTTSDFLTEGSKSIGNCTEDIRQHLKTKKTWSGILTQRKKDNTTYDEEATIYPVLDTGGQVIYYAKTSRDITEHRKIEDQLRQAQKMEAIGRLAGGIAHDFNNLLTGIRGSVELALLEMKKEGNTAAIMEHLDDIKDVTDRAVELVSQLLALSRKQVISPKIIDLNEIVKEMERIIRRIIGEHIICVTRLESTLSPIRIDPGQLEQILMNLSINAADAMRDGGRLTISTKMEYLDPAYCRSNPGVKTGWYVQLSVSDTGTGMNKETLSHIFEPFFTTKTGKGTGLGLSTVYGIVKQSQGHIEVDSEQGKGTIFKLYFEPAEGISNSGRRTRIPDSVRKGSETIVVVEDEEVVRKLIRRILDKAGYNAYFASNSAQALELLRSLSKKPQLLLTDLVLPGMNGNELAKNIREIIPDIKVLLMSGYTEDIISYHLDETETTNFMAKPFNMTELLNKIREILDSPTP